MEKLVFQLAIAMFIALLSITACDKRGHSVQSVNTGTANDNGGNTDKGIVEGTINGGGGKGVRCRQNGQESVEALDLFEAKAYGLKLLPVPQTEADALDLAVEKLAMHMWNPSTVPVAEVKKELKKQFQESFLNSITFLDSGKRLRNVNDSHEVIAQEGCETVQVAVYYESHLLIDKKLWNKLDNLNKAAFWMHELIYLIERQNGRTDSVSTRLLVGQMFSSKGARPKADGVPNDEKSYITCSVYDGASNAGYLYAYETNENGQDGTEFVFNSLNTATYIMRTSAFFPRLRLIQLEARRTHDGFWSPLEVDSLSERRELDLRLEGETTTLTLKDPVTGKRSDFRLQCDRRSGYKEPGPGDVERSPVRRSPVTPAPAPIPNTVELHTRYDDIGSYEKTATYSFRFMTHDIKQTLNNWDILFEARSDFDKDFLEVNTVTDDDSFIYDLQKSCDQADPCDIYRDQLDAKSRTGKESSPYPDKNRKADVAKGHCYLAVSQDSSGAVTALFEIKDHVKNISAVIDHIRLLQMDPVKPASCDKAR